MGWHQDYLFRKPGINDLLNNFVQCIIAIDPCNDKTGGLRIIPKSYLLGALKIDLQAETSQPEFDVSLAVTPQLNPGDMIMFNPYMIHGSTANQSSMNRRVMINGYANNAHSQIGMQVMKGSKVFKDPTGIMEYEKDLQMLPLATKY